MCEVIASGRSVLCLLLVIGCSRAPEPSPQATDDPQAAFWDALAALCGRAFEGTVREAVPADTAFSGQPLIMHVRECTEHEIRIPFHVGEDRSRTWVITRADGGLRLKHDHRHADGSPDEVTRYGGDTAEPGTTTSQSFPADAETAALIPAAATNIWTLQIEPGTRFVYALRREGTERRFRAEFDLARPVSPPRPPWGARP